MNDALFRKITKYHHAVSDDNWLRINSAIRACPRQGIASYLFPLGARPEDGSEAFTQANQIETSRQFGKITGGVFFDNAAIDAYKKTGSLTLTIVADPAATIGVARAVVKLLKRRALSYTWDKNAPSKIVVDMTAHNKNFAYADMDAALEEYLLDGDVVMPAQSSG